MTTLQGATRSTQAAGAVAPPPPDEAQRLRALADHALLDTPPEEVFDRLTRLAASLLDMPVALISLIDRERQWFKSRIGVDVTETPRDVAFCGHAILGDGLLEVPDARADARFAGNPLVQGGPGIRFYAGAPLRTEDGHALGTLCVIDRTPRRLDHRQRQILEDLAAIAADELRLRRAAVTIRERQRSVERELARAREIMDGLLPSPAALARLAARTGLEAAGIVRPSTTIGGDYWSAAPIHDGVAMLFVADVCGHGITSALQAAAIHATLHPLPPFADDLERMQTHFDRRLGDFIGAVPGSFATACYVLVDRAARRLRHLPAGVPHPLLIGADGRARRLSGAGFPFGMGLTVDRPLHETAYEPGDCLMLFSDALLETRDGAGRLLADDEVAGLVDGPPLPAAGLVERAMARFLDRFGGALSDDITIVCARLP